MKPLITETIQDKYEKRLDEETKQYCAKSGDFVQALTVDSIEIKEFYFQIEQLKQKYQITQQHIQLEKESEITSLLKAQIEQTALEIQQE